MTICVLSVIFRVKSVGIFESNERVRTRHLPLKWNKNPSLLLYVSSLNYFKLTEISNLWTMNHP